MKLFKIGTSKRKSLDKEYVSKQGRKSDKTNPMFDDSDFVELDVDNAIENVKGDAETQGRNTVEQITIVRDTVNTKSDKTKLMFDDSDFAELDVDNAMENVEGDAETQGRNTTKQITTAGDTVNTASIDVSAVGPSNVSTADSSTSTAEDIFKDEMMTIVDTLVAIRSTRPRTTSVVIRYVEEEPKRATPVPTV
ncbi:hypothetical protein Tco_1258282 [Tanacetum coccineum]